MKRCLWGSNTDQICQMVFGRKGHNCYLKPTVTVNVCDATASPVQEGKKGANTLHGSISGCLHKRRFPAQGVGVGGLGSRARK